MLWKPKVRKRTRSIEMDMRNQIRPNPYYVQESDIGSRVFGSRLTKEDVGLRCQLVWDNAGVSAVFQIEGREQRDARDKR